MDTPLKRCPIRYSLDVIGGKWKLPIICLLAGEVPVRYGTLKRRLGNITNMMLAQSLRELESDGMVNRTQYNEIPPRVEYSLTAEAGKLVGTLQLLAGWGIGQMERTNAGEIYCTDCQESCQTTP